MSSSHHPQTSLADGGAATATTNGGPVVYETHHDDVVDLITATGAVRIATHYDDDDHYNHQHHHHHDDDNDYDSSIFSHHHQPASVVRPSRRPLHPLMAAAGAEHEARVRCRRQHYPQPANFRLGIDDGDVDDPRHHGQHSQHSNGDRRPSTEPWLPEAALAAEAQRNHFQLTKQHTGMKNMSYNVTAAVTAACDGPVDGADAVGRGTVQWTPPKSFVDAKPAHMKAAANGAGIPAYRPVANQLCESSQIAAATKRLQQEQQQQQHVAADVVQPDGITEQGYFDLKFYHNKLW